MGCAAIWDGPQTQQRRMSQSNYDIKTTFIAYRSRRKAFAILHSHSTSVGTGIPTLQKTIDLIKGWIGSSSARTNLHQEGESDSSLFLVLSIAADSGRETGLTLYLKDLCSLE